MRSDCKTKNKIVKNILKSDIALLYIAQLKRKRISTISYTNIKFSILVCSLKKKQTGSFTFINKIK